MDTSVIGAKIFITGLLAVSFGAWWVSMPLDAFRFRCSWMPTWLHLAGVIILLSSFYLIYLVYRENEYLSSVVALRKIEDIRRY
ncbi:MAG TPA: hypothetical protein VEG44_04770 [Candidatus Acidoferrales bacterium]|nr:hypothetical protein [Candidatus Acidoferrales bacterium]